MQIDDDSRMLAEVAQELQRRGVGAEFWHSGGGIMTVKVWMGQPNEANDFDWGLSEGYWGYDYSGPEGFIEPPDEDRDLRYRPEMLGPALAAERGVAPATVTAVADEIQRVLEAARRGEAV